MIIVIRDDAGGDSCLCSGRVLRFARVFQANVLMGQSADGGAVCRQISVTVRCKVESDD